MRLTDEERAELLAEKERAAEAFRAAKARLDEIQSRIAKDNVARLAELDEQTASRDPMVRYRAEQAKRALDKQMAEAALRAQRAREANRDPNPPHWLDAHEDRREAGGEVA